MNNKQKIRSSCSWVKIFKLRHVQNKTSHLKGTLYRLVLRWRQILKPIPINRISLLPGRLVWLKEYIPIFFVFCLFPYMLQLVYFSRMNKDTFDIRNSSAMHKIPCLPSLTISYKCVNVYYSNKMPNKSFCVFVCIIYTNILNLNKESFYYIWKKEA